MGARGFAYQCTVLYYWWIIFPESVPTSGCCSLWWLHILLQNYVAGHITEKEAGDAIFKHFFQGKLTFLHFNKGEEMAPTIGAQGGTLLVRKIPMSSPM